MSLSAVAPPLRRWIPLCLTALLVVAAVLALFWSAAAPAGAQDGSDTEVPAKPTGLSVATEPGSLEVSVDWDDVDGADDYLVRWRAHGPNQELNDGVRPTSSETTITVADYGRWVLRAQACNDGGCSGASALQFEVEPAPEPTPTPTPTPAETPTPTPTPEPPAQPGGLTVDTAAGSLDVGVDWDDVDGADGYLVRWRRHGPDQELNDGVRPTSSETRITVAGYGRWVVRVQACNDAGCGPGISQAADVAPAQPSVLAAVAATGALDLAVSWEQVAGADAYLVRWRPSDGDFEADQQASIAADGAENFNAAITVSDYGDWMVQVEACNDGTCGMSVAPPMSLDISVAAGALSVAATWDAVTGADAYEVRWRQPGEAFAAGDLVETAATGAAITVDDHGTWEVRVRACSGETCGPEVSYEANVTPARPANLAVAAGPGALNRTVTWEAAVGANTYEVRWGRPGKEFAAGDLVETATTSAAITVDDHGAWEVQVRACNDAGCSGASALQFEVEPAQEPLQVSIEASATVIPVGESVVLTAVITDPPADSEPSYQWELDLGDWLSAGTDPTLSYLTSVAESQAFRVTVSYDTGASGTSDPLTVTWEEPNRAPVVDEQAEKYAAFIDTSNAPRGTLASKEFGGVFSDPDGDTLTYTVTVPTGRSGLVDSVYVQEATQQVFIRVDGEDDWNAVTPALADPLVTTVTLTATDPRGLSASVSGDFRTQWDSRPVLLSATASGDAIKLTFDQAVQVSPAPAPGQFTVNVVNGDGSSGTISVESVAVSGATVTLDLVSAIEAGQSLTLDYAHDDDIPLKRAASGGDFASSFTGRAVALPSPDPPGQPGNLAVNPAEEALHLTATWDAVEGATYYQLRWRPSGGEDQASGQVRSTATDTVLEVSGNSATFAVPDDGEWLVSLEACNEGGCGQALEQVVGRQQTTPTVAITGVPAAINTVTALTATFTFGEDVTGFVVGDVTVTNGTKGTFTAVDAKSYTLVVTPQSGMDLTVTVTANSATDSDGNTGPLAAVTATATWVDGPLFGSATVADQSYTLGTAITDLVLPAATGGDGTLTYTLSPDPPAGLTFNAGTRTLSGTPSAGQGATEYTYTATDTNGDTASLTFTIGVSFGCGGSTAVGGVTSGGLVDDCEALLASEAALVGTGTGLNWDTGTAMASWDGVTLSGGRVGQLRRSGHGFAGTIPSELGDLSSLTDLNLSANMLTGEIPAELGDLSSLTLLYLYGNMLTGEIPAELGDLSSLTLLWLSDNMLTGEIPAELGDLSSLTLLHLDGNMLTGEIPAELGDLSSLTDLNLSGNMLTGEIPAELGDLSSLTDLNLSGNMLTGEIPAELGDLSSLTLLWLSDNMLTGEIPAELGNLPLLRYLNLRGNSLTGEIPAELGNLPLLRELHLHNNALTGEIPAELGNPSSLTHLHLHNNALTGEIPAELGNLPSLNYLNLRGNSLTGEIPAELGNLSNLIWLHLYNNALTGEIPSELGDLSRLTVLDLKGNTLTGEIPSELGNLSNLIWLLLYSNALTGEIPSELGNLSSLNYLRLHSNMLTGEIPSELGNLSSLADLQLHNNMLTGCIPVQVQALSARLQVFRINPQSSGANLPVCPGAPTLTLAAGDAEIVALWTVPSGTTPTGYDVEYKLSSASAWTDAGHTGTVTTVTIGSLTNGSEYEVRVRAKVGVGAGEWSAVVSATPAAGAKVLKVAITGVPGKINATTQLTATFTFSESVTGFVVGDVTVTGGTKGTFTAVSTTEYTLLVTPTSGSDVTVTATANSATDSDGNTGPLAAVSATAVWDADAPTVAITGVPGKINAVTALTATFTFGEDVTGFVVGDVTVTDGTKGTFTAVSPKSYTLEVTPSSGKDLTVTVKANSATDSDGNTGPTAAVSATATWDAVVPTVAITGMPGKINTTTQLTATFTFSESVTGFVVGDVTVTGGTKGTFTAVSTTEYTLAVTPTGSADVTVTVTANSATDGVNTGPAAATSATTVWDVDAPTVAITGVPGKINAVTALTATFTFGEDVTGFVVGDVTVTDGTKGTFTAVSPKSYTLEVTPSSGKDLTVTVKANSATDGASNTGPTAAVSATATWDVDAPTVAITGVPGKINAVTALTATFTFGEDVTGFVVGDVTVTDGTKGTFTAVSPKSYTLEVTPSSGKDLTVTVKANSATDSDGNTGPTAAVSATATWDAVVPTVAITGMPGKINTTTQLTATFTFSESVTGFVVGDVTVTGGTKGTFTAVSTTEYTLAVTPTGSADVTVTVTANSATDGVNTGPAAATSATTVWDVDAPTVAITGVPGKINAVTALTATFTFGEDVTGFVVGDVTVTDGTKGTFTAVSPKSYTLEVTPSSGKDLTVTVKANSATDGASNTGPTAAVSATATWDAVVPTVAITGMPGKINTTTQLTATFTFGEDVTGFVVGDVTVTGGTKGTFTAVSTTEYTLAVTPTGSADVTVTVTANSATDGVNTGPAAATSATTVWDVDAPTVAITGVPGKINAVTALTATFTFGEDVTGFVVGDVTVTDGTKGTFTAVSPKSYTLEVTPSSGKDLTVTVKANSATDGASNTGPTAAVSATATWDAVVPTVAITGMPGKINTTTQLTATFTFSESVTGFVVGDVTVTGGTKGTFTAVSPKSYTLEVTPSSGKDLTVTVKANSATDGASNTGPTAAVSATATWDAVVPTVAITGMPGKINTTTQLTATFTFSESVTGFVVGDVTVTGGTKGTFTAVSTTEYTLAVTPTGSADVTVTVKANSATDGVNTGPAAATSATTVWDVDAPTVAITGVPGKINAVTALTATFTFGEDVTGFVVGDVTVTDGTKGTFTAVSPKSYTLEVTPSSGKDLTVTVKANSATDGASNTGPTAAVSATATWDAVVPTVAITGMPGKINTTTQLTATFTFSESVTGFVVGDVTVTGGTKGTFTAVSTTEYTLAVTPTGSADVTVTVTANSATDGVNTGPAAATSATTVWDVDAPTVAITGVPGKINAVTALTATFTFGEDVTGFVVGDVTVTDGTKGTFTAVSPKSYTLEVTPSSGKDLTVTVKANSATDGASNTGPTAAVSATATWDVDAPTVAITGMPGKINTTTQLTATFTFSESVTGFVVGDVTVTGGTKGTFTAVSPKSYTLEVTPSSGKDLTVTVKANSATDGASNTGPTAAVSATATWDAVVPTVAITGMPGKINTTTQLTATFTFSESVTGFVVGDVTVTGGTKGTFTAVSTTEYTLAVTPTGSADVTVTVTANSATDGVNTGPAAATSATTVWDVDAPTVAITGVPGKINAVTALTATFTFGEDVTGFVVGDVTVTDGTKGTFTAVSPKSYTLEVTPSSGKDLTVTVKANSATDGASNTGPTAAVSATATWEIVVSGGVAIVSTPSRDTDGDNIADTYVAGDTVRIRVTFSQVVNVNTTGGNPRLKIDMDPAHRGEKWAEYQTGGGTTTLDFVYHVVSPDLSTDGIAVLQNSLELNGATIRDATTGQDALLDHEGLAHDRNHRVDAHRPVTTWSDMSAFRHTLELRYPDQELDPDSVPNAGYFSITVSECLSNTSRYGHCNPTGDWTRRRTLQLSDTDPVVIEGDLVILTLAEALKNPWRATSDLLVGYTPGDNPIRDLADNEALGFADIRLFNSGDYAKSPTDRLEREFLVEKTVAIFKVGGQEHDWYKTERAEQLRTSTLRAIYLLKRLILNPAIHPHWTSEERRMKTDSLCTWVIPGNTSQCHPFYKPEYIE